MTVVSLEKFEGFADAYYYIHIATKYTIIE